jgi:hypothetical protein
VSAGVRTSCEREGMLLWQRGFMNSNLSEARKGVHGGGVSDDFETSVGELKRVRRRTD